MIAISHAFPINNWELKGESFSGAGNIRPQVEWTYPEEIEAELPDLFSSICLCDLIKEDLTGFIDFVAELGSVASDNQNQIYYEVINLFPQSYTNSFSYNSSNNKFRNFGYIKSEPYLPEERDTIIIYSDTSDFSYQIMLPKKQAYAFFYESNNFSDYEREASVLISDSLVEYATLNTPFLSLNYKFANDLSSNTKYIQILITEIVDEISLPDELKTEYRDLLLADVNICTDNSDETMVPLLGTGVPLLLSENDSSAAREFEVISIDELFHGEEINIKTLDVVFESSHQLIQNFNSSDESLQYKLKISISKCYAAQIDILKNLKDPNISPEKAKSISECYSNEIKNIKKAREVLYKRREMLYDNFDLNPNIKLRNYIRNNEVQQGFKLVDTLDVDSVDKSKYKIRAYDTKTGEYKELTIDGDSAYAIIDKKFQGNLIWEYQEFVDQDTGKVESGIYIADIAEVMDEARKLLGDRDKHGMRLNGVIIFVNGEEPGNGTLTLHNYKVKQGDTIEIVYKNDMARY